MLESAEMEHAGFAVGSQRDKPVLSQDELVQHLVCLFSVPIRV
jgi:hypothetical protein